MIAKLNAFLVVVLITTFLATPANTIATSTPAYVDPSLALVEEDAVSAIVTGVDVTTAADAVRVLGGRVTRELAIVDAVAATLPADQLPELANMPGIRSILQDQPVRASGAISITSGYVTERRARRGVHVLNDEIRALLAVRPGGGAVSVSLNGHVLFLDSDGKEVVNLTLDGGHFTIQPVVDNAGCAYIIDDAGNIYALSAEGALQWRTRIPTGSSAPVGATLSPKGQLIVATGKRLYAIETAAGQIAWRVKLSDRNSGPIVGAPAVAPDGTLYVTTQGQDKEAQGRLLAITPDGHQLWTFVADKKQPFDLPAVLSQNGTIYVASTEGTLYAINADGSSRFRFTVDGKIWANPVVGADEAAFLAADDGLLYAVNGDGSLRFELKVGDKKFRQSLALSPEGDRLYVIANDGHIYAVDSVAGQLLWDHGDQDESLVGPVVDLNGNIHIGDTNGHYIAYTPDGREIAHLDNFAAISQKPVVDRYGTAFFAQAEGAIAVVGRMPKQWDGRPDVLPGNNKKTWRLANPYGIDVGADELHDIKWQRGQRIRGDGVTIAVLDSGIFFDSVVKHELGQHVKKLYLGQADFIDRICEKGEKKRKHPGPVGEQHDGYCFEGPENSKDGFGHGTHVAGIIWSNFIDYNTDTYMGIAPDAHLLSVRVLGNDGYGTYADAIAGIQYVIENKDKLNIRVLNISMSADATVPYFVNPLNRAVEKAWAAGIVVVAAAGNSGPYAETITVPGNDPYVITVGAVDSLRTPGYWPGDNLPRWSATGPTADGFIKPDVLAPGSQIVSFMHNDTTDQSETAKLAEEHSHHSEDISLFRMSGTSMATAVTSGVVALMLQVHPELTPDQVKFRLAYSARPAITGDDVPLYNMLQQGMGRIWAPAAVLGDFPADGRANQGMDIEADLAHGYANDADLAFHYQGPVHKLLSDDGQTYLFYTQDSSGATYGLGAMRAEDMSWIDWPTLSSGIATWSGAYLGGDLTWVGGLSAPAGLATWSGGVATWSGGVATWSGGLATWSGGIGTWSGGLATWSGGLATWSGGIGTWSGGLATWSGSIDTRSATVGATRWVEDDATPGVTDPAPEQPSDSPPDQSNVPAPGTSGETEQPSSSYVYLPSVFR